MDFQNRVAIITGGAGALGGAATLDLLASGARAAVTYRAESEWAALESRAVEHRENLWGARVDLTDAAAVRDFIRAVVERWQRIDFLLCIAGAFAAGKSYETEEATWDRMFDLNLKSVYTVLRGVVPVMIGQNFGRIVTVSSGAILRGGGAGIAAYALAKGAVLKLTEVLAEELKDYDIRAHSVLPGTMDTAANRLAMPRADFSRWVKTEDVARVMHFLLGDQARAVRSVAVPVEG